MKKENNPIFIHSLFRTGSTYIWHKFRQNDQYYCYYEPFHQVLAQVTPKNIEHTLSKNYDLVKHPHLTRYYLYEYKPLLKNGQSGVPYFKKSFSFDEFCNNEVNPDLKSYIDYLIDGAGDKVPVFQFNRSALRVRWFKENYPGSLNLYLARNPRDQWESYVELYKRTDYIGFFLMDLLIASLNKDKENFHLLSGKLPLFHFNGTNKEESLYRVVLDSYSEEEKYLVFYYTWFKALLENVLYADSILNINLLSYDSAYKAKVTKFLDKRDINGVNFDDAKVMEYSQYPLDSGKMEDIEENVRNSLIQSLTEEEFNGFFQNISADDMRYFHLGKKDFIQIRKERIKSSPYTPEMAIKKLGKIILLFADRYFKQIEETKTMEGLLKQKNAQFTDTVTQVELQNNYLAQKDRLILKKDEELEKRNLLLGEKDEQLSQKDVIINEKDQLIAEKDEKLQQKDSIISEKDQLILHKDEQLRQKDRLIDRKSRMISKEDREIQQKLFLMEEKEKQLKQKDRLITEKDIQLQQNSEQMQEIKEQIQHLRSSYTYRIGRVIAAPLKAVKRLISKLLRVRDGKGFPRHMAKPISVSPVEYEKKVNLADQLRINFGRHRSGWTYALRNLSALHNPNGVLFDSFIERTFCWHPQGVKPHLQPWIGFIHIPPKMPKWFSYNQSNEVIFNSETWKESLPHCRGLFTLSKYHRKYLEGILDIPVNHLFFPAEIPKLKWNWDRFTANKNKKIVQVGWWLRKLHAVYQLPLPGNPYKKIFLSVEHKNLQRWMNKERDILLKEGTFNDDMYKSAKTITYLPNHAYDKLLGENIVFVFLYDSSANNTVIECIARNTPILINPLEAVKEYLGDDYPLYYDSLEEAAEKALNFDLIYKTHQYLINHPFKHKLTGKHFLTSFANSRIYRSLELNPVDRKVQGNGES